MKETLRKGLFLVVFAVFLFAGLVSFAEDKPLLRVTFLNIGQGDAALIRSEEKTVLIDSGDDRSNSAKGVIIPYCKKNGIDKIDTCVISHPHRDHFGGFLELIQEVPVGEFVYSTEGIDPNDSEGGGSDAQLYQRLVSAIREKNIPYRKVKVGYPFDWGKEIIVELLHSEETTEVDESFPEIAGIPNFYESFGRSANQNFQLDATGTTKISANDQSLIFKVSAGNISYLFTGDSEQNAESHTVAAFKEKLKCTVLKSGHHGSKTSSSFPFLDMAKPEYGVISVGAYNSFGHPNKETLEKYAFYKMKVFRTDQDGTIESFTDGKEVRFTSNQSVLEFSKFPQVISLTPNSTTIQWETNKLSDTEIWFGEDSLSSSKKIENSVTIHTVTLSSLKPKTAYKFRAISHDSRHIDQVVSAEGEFITPIGDGVPIAKIDSMGLNLQKVYVQNPFNVTAVIGNPANSGYSGFSLELYHTAMTDGMLLGVKSGIEIPPHGKISIDFPVTISWTGNLELLAVLKKGTQILDTSSLSVDVNAKLLLVDCAHGNIDYYSGKFAGMKMDLGQKLGISFKSISKPFAPEIFRDAFVVVIPDPQREFSFEEIAALKDYVLRGGALLLFCRADFDNRSHPQFFNSALKAIGSGLRFNDDEVIDPTNNIGHPWGAFIRVFPSQITQGVQNLLVRSACSLLNDKMEGLTSSKNIQLLAMGDDDTSDIDKDELNDGWLYASHSPQLPVPVAACDDLGLGRIACVGEPLYDDRLYNPNPSLQTPLFNRSVVAWLIAGKDKSLGDLLAYASDLDEIPDAELRAIRYEVIKTQVEEKVKLHLYRGNSNLVKSCFDGNKGVTVEKLKKDVDRLFRFKSLHNEIGEGDK